MKRVFFEDVLSAIMQSANQVLRCQEAAEIPGAFILITNV